LEAAASNSTILSSNCKNGPMEIIENYRGGFMFESNNKEDLINKFNLFMKTDNKEIFKKKIFVKKKTKFYTKFRHFVNLENFLNSTILYK